MKKCSRAIVALIATLLLGLTVLAAVPQLITYQGRLTTSTGSAVSGSKLMKFTLYNGAGTAVWNTGYIAVSCTEGLFSVQLGGSGQPALPQSIFADTAATLGVTVDVDPEMTPRTRLTSLPFVYNALTSDTSGYAKGLADNTVSSLKIVDGSISFADIAQNGAAVGQIMKWNGSAWAAADDSVGATGSFLPLTGGTMTGAILSTGQPEIRMGKGNFGTANSNSGIDAFVAGSYNAANSMFSGILSGRWNSAGVSAWDDTGAVVGGGFKNAAVKKYAFVGGGQFDTANGIYCTVGGGFWNISSGQYCTVAGGSTNRSNGIYCTIGGGSNNTTGFITYATIAGGQNNSASSYATIAGGAYNNAVGIYSAIGGGVLNNVYGERGTIGGGESNVANSSFSGVGSGQSNVAGQAATDSFSFVGGGRKNQAKSRYTFVGGGFADSALNDWATVSGGAKNKASGLYSTVGGGYICNAVGSNAAVAGGYANFAQGDYSAIGGGTGQNANGMLTTIAGGYYNAANGAVSGVASGQYNNTGQTSVDSAAFVGGGISNYAKAKFTTVAGGWADTAWGENSAVGGGYHNYATGTRAVIAGGENNHADGWASMVPGGNLNTALGNYSFAAGERAKATHSGSFVWADNSNTDLNSFGVNTFTVRCNGGARFYTNTPQTAGVSLAAGGGSWSSISDRNVKANFSTVDGQAILDKLASMDVTTWNYKAQPDSIRHIGPMAQDFFKAFGVGEDSLHITSIDADGVALAAVKELIKQNAELKAEVAELKKLVESQAGDKAQAKK